MRAKTKVAGLGICVLGASVLLSPLFETVTAVPKVKPALMVKKKADIQAMLKSADRETKVAAAWEIADIPWKEGVRKQIDSAIEPLLKNLQDKDTEVRVVSAMALRSIAERGKSKRLSEGMMTIQEAFEKETEKEAKDELKLLRGQMRRTQDGAGSFY